MTLKQDIADEIETAIVSLDLHEVPMADWGAIAEEVTRVFRNHIHGMRAEDLLKGQGSGASKLHAIQIMYNVIES